MRHEQVVLVNGVFFGLAAVAFLYGLVRMSGAGPGLSALGVALGFVANSYEGADMIRAIIQQGQSFAELKNVNIDAVTRWFYKGMPADGLQRMLLYQPHHLTGYVQALAALWLVGFAEDVTETSVALWAGVLLAFALLFSTFTALIVGLAVGLLFALRLTQQRRWRAAIGCAVLGGVPIVVGVALTKALGYTDDRYGFLLVFGLNPVAVNHLGKVLFLSFGPLLFGGIATIVRWRWALKDGAAATTLVIAAFAFYFFTNVPDSGDVWVGWRSGHLLLIAFGVMSACALNDVWRIDWSRTVVAIGVSVAILLGIPTVVIDVYNAQDVTNRADGRGLSVDPRHHAARARSAGLDSRLDATRGRRAGRTVYPRLETLELHHRLCRAPVGCRLPDRDDADASVSRGRGRRLLGHLPGALGRRGAQYGQIPRHQLPRDGDSRASCLCHGDRKHCRAAGPLRTGLPE